MRHHPQLVTLLLLGVLTGCGRTPVGDPGDPANPMGLDAVVAGEPDPVLALGEPIPVVLHNRSGTPVSVGALDCLAELEILDRKRGRWYRIPSLRFCIEIAVWVADGADHPFVVPAPDVAGRYRVVFEAHPGTGGSLTVHSNAFDVQRPTSAP